MSKILHTGCRQRKITVLSLERNISMKRRKRQLVDAERGKKAKGKNPKGGEQVLKLTAKVGSIDRKVFSFIQKLTEKLVVDLKVYIQRNFYDTLTPAEYERTYDLIDCIRSEVKGNIQSGLNIRVYFDTDVIRLNNEKRQHTGFNSEDFRYGLINSVDNGFTGWAGNPHFGESVNFSDWCLKYVYDGIKDGMKEIY